MKLVIVGLIVFFFLDPSFAQQPDIIPLPNKYNKANFEFILSSNTVIVADNTALKQIAWFFQKEVLKYSGIPLPVKAKGEGRSIRFIRTHTSSPEDESYVLEMSDRLITVTSNSEKGLFDGAVSLLQMIRKSEVKDRSIHLPCWNINDRPLYTWRGFMLDESRHFFGKEKVKSLLDWMAYYKLNRFHWHLTDRPGWRIDIKQYPKLAVVGGIGNFTNPFAAANYYTQADIEEIVRYAAERFIDIIPEIDMPGHATASNMAYPEFNGGGSELYPDYTFNPGKEGTYNYLSNILREVDVLFPSQMIHIGGDEVSYGNKSWTLDPDVKALMKQYDLTDLKKVEKYFLQRMADSVKALDNKILAWDEAVDGDLPVNETIIFWWRHNHPEQLKKAIDKGYAIVLCPRLPLYLDFVQDSTLTRGRKWDGLFNSLENVYGFSHLSIPESRNGKARIIGIQGNLWTETIPDVQRLDFMLYPRICALAEAAWTDPENRNFTFFENRLKPELELYKKAGLYFYEGKYAVKEQ